MILKKISYLGGLAHAFSYKGFRFDGGGHRFLTDKPNIYNFVKTLLSKDFRLSRNSCQPMITEIFNKITEIVSSVNNLCNLYF